MGNSYFDMKKYIVWHLILKDLTMFKDKTDGSAQQIYLITLSKMWIKTYMYCLESTGMPGYIVRK